ncbi:hypothetical protein ECC02_004790 [Trypanosoma cruzi]|uniref:Uncharacterized protein n=1 Tax=Trypanosoma cruzi TaxID=5693 RepID=A0A7J6Y5R1_TRYCR|nr:hypothetical protein ECC02_004790 [Trypanosoma cruzi]
MKIYKYIYMYFFPLFVFRLYINIINNKYVLSLSLSLSLSRSPSRSLFFSFFSFGYFSLFPASWKREGKGGRKGGVHFASSFRSVHATSHTHTHVIFRFFFLFFSLLFSLSVSFCFVVVVSSLLLALVSGCRQDKKRKKKKRAAVEIGEGRGRNLFSCNRLVDGPVRDKLLISLDIFRNINVNNGAWLNNGPYPHIVVCLLLLLCTQWRKCCRKHLKDTQALKIPRHGLRRSCHNAFQLTYLRFGWPFRHVIPRCRTKHRRGAAITPSHLHKVNVTSRFRLNCRPCGYTQLHTIKSSTFVRVEKNNEG